MKLDFVIRARIHAFQNAILEKNITGLGLLCPCIRSIMVSVMSIGLRLVRNYLLNGSATLILLK